MGNQREEKKSTAAAYLACVRYETVLTSGTKHELKQNMNVLAKLVKATDFAAKKHRNDRRKDADKTPYINHPIGVAEILTWARKLVFSASLSKNSKPVFPTMKLSLPSLIYS